MTVFIFNVYNNSLLSLYVNIYIYITETTTNGIRFKDKNDKTNKTNAKKFALKS